MGLCLRKIIHEMGYGSNNIELTFLVDNRLILNVLRSNSKASDILNQEPMRLRLRKTYLRVLRVSCLNLIPGAKLHMSRPTDEPPSASCRMRVNFELR